MVRTGRPKIVTEDRIPLNVHISVELNASAHALIGIFDGTMQELVSSALASEIERRLTADGPRTRDAHAVALEKRLKALKKTRYAPGGES